MRMPTPSPRLFARYCLGGLDRLTRAIEDHFAEDSYEVGKGVWLLAAKGTVKEPV
jgi:hypothetical protein